MSDNVSVPLNDVLEIEKYISKYDNIEKVFSVLEDNYFIETIDKQNKEELVYQISTSFPLVQAVMSIIGELLRDTNESFYKNFDELISKYNV